MRSTVKLNITLEEALRQLDFSGVPGDQEVAEAVRQRLTKGEMTLVDFSGEETLQPRDVAVLRLESGLPWFDRERVTVNIGGELFDKELEDALVGKRVGDAGTAAARGAEVRYTVLSAKRLAVPEPTDEMVEAQGEANIHTVAEFTAFYGDKLRDQALSMKILELIGKLKENAEVQVAQEDLDRIHVRVRENWLQTLREKGVEDPEKDITDHWRQSWEVDTFDEFIERECKGYERAFPGNAATVTALGLADQPAFDPVENSDVFVMLFMKLKQAIAEEYQRRNG